MPGFDLLEPARDLEDSDLIDEALKTVRTHFGMPVAYLSRFEGEELVFRNVSAPGLEDLIKPDDRWALKETYCPRILSGELPNLIPDTALEPICQEMAVTSDVPIRSHISLPVYLDDGALYGMFCCLSPEPNPTLNNRDLDVMSTFLRLVARQVQQDERAKLEALNDLTEMEALLNARAFTPAFQPLVSLPGRRAVGMEALIRFAPPYANDTEAVFARASRVGLGIALEEAAIATALRALPEIDEALYVSLNASCDLICDAAFDELLQNAPPERLVIEVTERNRTREAELLKHRIREFQRRGMRIAIDDVGAGYSDLQRITHLAPDILKVDRSLVSSLDRDATKRAAVSALCYFAAETGAVILAEGVETETEVTTLEKLGVTLAQGWLFGRPAPIEAIAKPASRSA